MGSVVPLIVLVALLLAASAQTTPREATMKEFDAIVGNATAAHRQKQAAGHNDG